MASVPLSTVADTIISLANEIARASPDSAEKAMQIVDLAGEFDRIPDRTAVQDAIEATLADADLSDPKIQTTTSAVVSAVTKSGADIV